VREGEVVVTGLDRPVNGLKTRPNFFGHPASVPIHYVSLAMRAKAPLVVMASVLRPNGKIHILTSDFIEMHSYSDRKTGLITNAERVLEIAAGYISQAPHQWSIIAPVWPQVLGEVP
jgi:KDO2-lipid IV(A) lauroyltransferase